MFYMAIYAFYRVRQKELTTKKGVKYWTPQRKTWWNYLPGEILMLSRL
jgi:hypothetical protein